MLALLWSCALRAKRTAVVTLGIACDQMPSWHHPPSCAARYLPSINTQAVNALNSAKPELSNMIQRKPQT